MLRGVLAFFWIALAGVSGVYLYSAFANPAALGGQLANPLPVASGETTSAVSGSGSRDQELAEIKASLRQLTQQMAAISTKLNLDRDALASAEDSADSEAASEPETPPAPSPEAEEPEVAAAPPAPPPPPAPAVEQAKPAEAPKPEPQPEAKPVEQAAVEVKPTPPHRPKSSRRPNLSSRRRSPCRRSTTSRPRKSPRRAATCRRPPRRLRPLSQRPRLRLLSVRPRRRHQRRQRPLPQRRRLLRAPHSIRSRCRPRPMTAPRATASKSAWLPSRTGLRPLWREFLTNHAALVAGLQPRRVLAPDKKWRLIAGPFSSAAEASQACALFKKASRPCEATVYAGDGL